MSKATEEDLATLHGEVARALTDVISEGVTIAQGEGTVKVAAPASYFAAAIGFLKANNITADPGKNKDLADLAATLTAKRKDKKAGMNQRDLTAATAELDKQLGSMGLLN